MGWAKFDGLGLFWDLRIVCGGAKTDAGFRRVCGAILVLLDHTVVLLGFSSSAEDGGGRSPYNPPSILTSTDFLFCSYRALKTLERIKSLRIYVNLGIW